MTSRSSGNCRSRCTTNHRPSQKTCGKTRRSGASTEPTFPPGAQSYRHLRRARTWPATAPFEPPSPSNRSADVRSLDLQPTGGDCADRGMCACCRRQQYAGRAGHHLGVRLAPAALSASTTATCSSTSSSRPICSANAISGTSPQIRVVERDVDHAMAIERLHLAGAASTGFGYFLRKEIFPGQAAPAWSFPSNPDDSIGGSELSPRESPDLARHSALCSCYGETAEAVSCSGRYFPASRAIQTSVRTPGGPMRLSGWPAPKKV